MAKNEEEKKIDIFKSFLVPKHEVLSDKEKKDLLKLFGANTKQLPKILKEDPAVLALGAKTEDVIKITRPSENAGEAIYYRVVK